MVELSTNTILYYISSSIFFILFTCLILPTIYTIIYMNKKLKIEDEIITIRKRTFIILLLMCIVQILASLITILDNSLYLIYSRTWSYYVGHTLIVSCSAYTLNLIGQVLTFAQLVNISFLFIKICHKALSLTPREYKIFYYSIWILSFIYGFIIICLLIMILVSALPHMPYGLEESVTRVWREANRATIACGWLILTFLVFCVALLCFIACIKLYHAIRTAVSETVSKSVKVIILTIALSVIALIQVSSTIVGSFASYQRSLYVVSYCIDKGVGMIFLIVCLTSLGPFVELLNYMKKIKKVVHDEKKEEKKEEEEKKEDVKEGVELNDIE